MNKHVLLAIKFLNDPLSVTRKEIEDYYDSIEYPNFHGSPEYAVECAFDNIYHGLYTGVYLWINEYFRLSGENRADYEKEI